jgi:hypothetical protein
MISKSEFIEIVTRIGMDRVELEAELESTDWNTFCDAVAEVKAQMPGIGFLSRSQRMSAFIAVCRHVDELLEIGKLSDLGETQLVLMILRLTSKRFEKASVMFDINAHRIGPATRATFPRTAIEYLAGLNAYG